MVAPTREPMKELAGRVAVVTGAADGIGRAIAGRCAEAGMRLVLADVDRGRLEVSRAELERAGAEVLGCPTDVSRAAEVEALAVATYARFGACHLLVNNAGVALGKPVWEATLADWEWVLGVNLYGVIHGVRAFVPRMLEAGEPGHVVNTASIAGLISPPGLGPYNVSKHGVVTLSESLHGDLAVRGAPIGVSVLCPAWVRTRIAESERHRPKAERTDASRVDGVAAKVGAAVEEAVEAGIAPAEVARAVLDAVASGRFYILTHPHTKKAVQIRAEDILDGRPPTILPF